MIYEITHETQYDYDAPVTASYAQVHQMPDSLDGQVSIERSITTSPAPAHRSERVDYFGNLTTTIAITEPHTTLLVTSTSVVDTDRRPSVFDAAGDRPWEAHLVAARPADDLVAVEFSIDSPLVVRSSELRSYGAPSFEPGRSLTDAINDLTRRIHAEFAFDPDATDVDTPIGEVLARRRGVCQDFAHVMIGSLRSTGLAACYVSGYLETDPPPGKARLTGADRTHAWVGIHLGGDAWIGVDPTNNQIAGPRYVTTSRGRDYADVPPLKGVIFTDAEKSTLRVAVDVAPR